MIIPARVGESGHTCYSKIGKNSVCQRTDYISIHLQKEKVLQVQIQFLQLHKSVASFQDRTGIISKCQYLFFSYLSRDL